MTIAIWIEELSENKLVINPVYNSWNANNYAEIAGLQAQLAQVGLKENEDYRVFDTVDAAGKKHEKKIEFSGKSCVVRALWTIPKEWVRLYHPVTDAVWEKTKLKFATAITEKECSAYDLRFRKAAFDNFYAYIKNEIGKIHTADAKKTAVMERLDADLAFVETGMPVDHSSWATPKSHYALACLAKASADEKAQPTVPKPYRPKCLFTPESVLAPKYEAVLQVVLAIQDRDLNPIRDVFISDYNIHIAAKRGEVKAAAAAAVAPAIAAAKK